MPVIRRSLTDTFQLYLKLQAAIMRQADSKPYHGAVRVSATAPSPMAASSRHSRSSHWMPMLRLFFITALVLAPSGQQLPVAAQAVNDEGCYYAPAPSPPPPGFYTTSENVARAVIQEACQLTLPSDSDDLYTQVFRSGLFGPDGVLANQNICAEQCLAALDRLAQMQYCVRAAACFFPPPPSPLAPAAPPASPPP